MIKDNFVELLTQKIQLGVSETYALMHGQQGQAYIPRGLYT